MHQNFYMTKSALFCICSSLALLILSCGSNDQQPQQGEVNMEEIGKYYEPKDSVVVDAYMNDKSSISINDIDPNDASYSTRSKFLYESIAGGTKLAVVYGFKSDNSPGVAIIQRNMEKPIKLPQTKSTGINQAEYSDGVVRLVRDEHFVFLHDDSGTEQFEEIK